MSAPGAFQTAGRFDASESSASRSTEAVGPVECLVAPIRGAHVNQGREVPLSAGTVNDYRGNQVLASRTGEQR